ncbi:site-2 protease family protein [Lujinxingia litoralis]|nr:site-2 protease family protein [Lujinxingia litoralis]
MAMLVVFPAFTGGSVVAGLMWALAVTISLLVHEFGHALVAQRYGLGPSVLLHGFGGLCTMEREADTDGQDARVVFAGPAAGLLFGGLVYLVTLLAPTLVYSSGVMVTFVIALLYVNIVWSLVNLLVPMWPLDGGQLFHLLLRRFKDEEYARRTTLTVSIFVAIPAAIVAFLMFRSLLIGFFAVMVVMNCMTMLQNGQSLVGRRSTRSQSRASDFHQELLVEAEAALADEDWREAYRLCHQMRASGTMPQKMLDRVWGILGVSATEMGEWDEALGYLERAPRSPEAERAAARCRDALRMQSA